ncbi:MAG: hypothetical protein WC842_02475 [Candidatus Paceibacterota bacterium]|jgi:hypothetical protein
MKPFLSIVIPVRDEGEKLLDSLLSLDYMLSLSEFSYECICVCSRKAESSIKVCEKFSKLVKYMRVCEIKGACGWRELFLEGMHSARGNVRMFLDPGIISVFIDREKILERLREGYECIIAIDEDIEEGEYKEPNSIPKMIVFGEEMLPTIEKKHIISHDRRSLLVEIIGFLLKNKIKIYAFPLPMKEKTKVNETLFDKFVNKTKLMRVKREHKRITRERKKMNLSI